MCTFAKILKYQVSVCLAIGGLFLTSLPHAAEPAPTSQVAPISFGGDRTDFTIGGHDAFVILPKSPASAPGTRAWVWYAPTFSGRLPNADHEWLFSRLLQSGFAIAGVDVGESYGNPDGRKTFSKFHSHVVEEFKLSPRVSLVPQSRGGLMLYNWAAENADNVQSIAGIYTVCNLASYPGINKAASAYNLTPELLTERLAEHNPIDRLSLLAKAKVPIFHIHGDSDKVVPLDKNAGELIRRYRALGGAAELVVIPGKGHQVCPEFFRSERLLKFLLSHGGLEPNQENRGLIKNP